MHQFRNSLLALLGMLLAACEMAPPTTPAPPPPPARETQKAPDPTLAARREAQTYLDNGLVALQADRLLFPQSDNAYLWFTKALQAVPDYERAEDGIERIAERYLQLASQAASGDALDRAALFVERAKSVLPDYPQIANVEEQVKRLRDAKRRVLKLDSDQLKTRSPMLAADLAVFGRHARVAGSLVRIFVPSDSIGRWVYEQLSRSKGEQRIRADIVTNPPYRVQLLILEH